MRLGWLLFYQGCDTFTIFVSLLLGISPCRFLGMICPCWLKSESFTILFKIRVLKVSFPYLVLLLPCIFSDSISCRYLPSGTVQCNLSLLSLDELVDPVVLLTSLFILTIAVVHVEECLIHVCLHLCFESLLLPDLLKHRVKSVLNLILGPP